MVQKKTKQVMETLPIEVKEDGEVEFGYTEFYPVEKHLDGLKKKPNKTKSKKAKKVVKKPKRKVK